MSNTCNCPNPPGGIVRCETNQMALCIVKDGQAFYKCLNPPYNRYFRRYEAEELVGWALHNIIGDRSHLTIPIESDLIEILKSGFYDSRNFSDHYELRFVTFSLPEVIIKAIDEIRY